MLSIINEPDINYLTLNSRLDKLAVFLERNFPVYHTAGKPARFATQSNPGQ